MERIKWEWGRGKGPLEKKLENDKETMVVFTLLPSQEFKACINVWKHCRKETCLTWYNIFFQADLSAKPLLHITMFNIPNLQDVFWGR